MILTHFIHTMKLDLFFIHLQLFSYLNLKKVFKVHGCFTHMCDSIPHTSWCLQRPEEGTEFSGTIVTNGCELLCAGNCTRALSR